MSDDYFENHFLNRQLENLLQKDEELKQTLYGNSLSSEYSNDDAFEKLKYRHDILEMRVDNLVRAISLIKTCLR